MESSIAFPEVIGEQSECLAREDSWRPPTPTGPLPRRWNQGLVRFLGLTHTPLQLTSDQQERQTEMRARHLQNSVSYYANMKVQRHLKGKRFLSYRIRKNWWTLSLAKDAAIFGDFQSRDSGPRDLAGRVRTDGRVGCWCYQQLAVLWWQPLPSIQIKMSRGRSGFSRQRNVVMGGGLKETHINLTTSWERTRRKREERKKKKTKQTYPSWLGERDEGKGKRINRQAEWGVSCGSCVRSKWMEIRAALPHVLVQVGDLTDLRSLTHNMGVMALTGTQSRNVCKGLDTWPNRDFFFFNGSRNKRESVRKILASERAEER